MSAPGTIPRIFVSYAHADRAWLRSLATHLRGALGSNDPEFIFFDENSLRSGDTWNLRLQQEVVARPIFIVALTPNSLASEFVRDEVELALRETAAHPERRFISLMVQACDPAKLSPKLLDYQITDFTQQPFNIAFAALLGAIRSYMGAWSAQQRPPAHQPGYPQPTYAPPPGYAAPQPQGYPPVYQPAPQPMTPPPQAPLSPPSAPIAPAAGQFAATPIAPAMTGQATQAPDAPPSPASAQALQMARDTHSAFLEESWVNVARRGDFALMLPDNANDGRLKTEVAIAYAELKQWDKASEAIERAMVGMPWRADLWLEKARMQLAFGQVDDALVSYDTAFGLVISDLSMRRQAQQAIFTERRKLLMDHQQWDEALANIGAELGESGNDLELLRIRAEVLLKLELRDEAAKPFLQRRLTTWMRRLGFETRTVRGVELVSAPLCAVPAGEFLMGSDSDVDPNANPDEEPQLPVKTGAYEIGRYAVTVAEYGCFVRAGGAPPDSYNFVGVLYDWDKMREHPDYPVINLSWRQAVAYARWLAEITGEPWRLPTEAEWEKAARWDAQNNHARIYPWGDTYDVACLCNSDNLGGVTRVGTFPRGASPYGAMDMSGNTSDFTSTIYRRYPYVTKDGREDLDAPGSRTTRGSGHVGFAKAHRAAVRTLARPDEVDRRCGFRLVRGEAGPGSQWHGGIIPTGASSTPLPGAAGNGGIAGAAVSPAQQLAQEAHFAYMTGKWEEAATKGDQALHQPENVSSLQLLTETTLAYAALQRWQESATWASRALAADAFNAEMWLALARAQRGLAQTNDALTSYNRGLAVVAPDKRALRLSLLTEQRGLLMEQLRWSEALSVLDEEIRLSSDQERMNLRAEILRQLG